ncbi:streptococcal hemagglutinin-like [Littorina saxatilis]|uniref:streptococcal hemagglutinin-like n=1 Tax=Littorina saxatilis TaxID=31220 RepID=UPI0038B47EBF
MNKVGEGKYQIGDSRTLIFVRVLRNHVMVRVGGGWDTLENYLDKHDPCRCQYKGHRSGGPRHQIIRRASTSNLVATRGAPTPNANANNTNNNNHQPQTSPRRMSTVAEPSHSSSSSSFVKGSSPGPAGGGGGGFVKAAHPGGFVKGSSPGPAAGSFAKGASPARSASPTPAKGPSPQRSASPVTTSTTSGANGMRRLPSTVSAHSLRESAGSLRESSGSLRESQSFRDARELRESRESSVGKSGLSRPSSPSLGSLGGHSQSMRQSYEQQQRSLQQLHLQQQQGQLPQHQAVQRCKSPSPSPSASSSPGVSRCVSPAVSGNRTIPRPVSRGASGIPRPQSPALAQANSNNSSATPNARRQLFSLNRSVSFDAPSKTDAAAADTTSHYSDDLDNMADTEVAATVPQGQGDKDALSIDQISTMTLSEFKKLINNNLSVPPMPDSDSGGGGFDSARSHENNGGHVSRGQVRRANSADTGGDNLSWSSVRDKARSVCNSIASSVSSRRPASSAGSAASHIIARRNLPKSPALSDSRSKTPSASERPKTPSAIGSERPKTPVSTYRPKTPVTSQYAYRPKTPTANAAGVTGEARPKTPSCPKTPTSIRRGLGSSSSSSPSPASRNSEFSRPKTPTRDNGPSFRPKTPTSLGSMDVDSTPNPRVKSTTVVSAADDVEVAQNSLRVKTSSFVHNEESDSGSVENSDTGAQRPTGLGLRTTSWASDNDDAASLSLSLPLSRRSQSPADDLDGDNSEIAEMMDGNITPCSSVSASLRDRPSTHSKIPKPMFTPRSVAMPEKTVAAGRVERTLPRPSTPVSRSSVERQLSSSDGGDYSEKPPVTPRRHAQIPRCATPSSTKSYTELFHAKRSQTPGPGSSSSNSASASTARPTTPGPGTSSGGLRAPQLRRGSLSRAPDMGQIRKAKSVTNLLQDSGRLSIADGTGDSRRQAGGVGARSFSTESQQRLQRQNATEGERMRVTRNGQGNHSVQVVDQTRNLAYHSSSPSTARRRLQQSASFDNNTSERGRSKTPGPGVGTGGGSRYVQQPQGIIRKPNIGPKPSTAAGSKAINRTEAWVDSTLHDPKRKQLPPNRRRAMTPNSLSITEGELMSRPLEEIQAALPSPADVLPEEVVAPPPEDPEMFRKMEQLFVKYREMELRASVCDTPGGGGGGEDGHRSYNSNANTTSTCSVSRSSGGSQGQGQALRSTSSSLRTSMTHSASFSSGISSARSHETDGSSRGPSVENDRFSKESSPADAAASTASFHHNNGAASNNGDYHHHHNGTEDPGSVSVTPRPNHHLQQQGAPAVSADDIADVEAEILSTDPKALVSKIKEILQVRPRKEDAGKAGGTRTRIPAPASLSRAKRSKSVSSLTNGEFGDHASLSVYEATPNGLDMTRDESTNSDVDSEYSRCETPVPKLAQPLTTGRSKLFPRGGGRSMSQEDHVSSSSSVSSSSLRYWDEDGEYV